MRGAGRQGSGGRSVRARGRGNGARGLCGPRRRSGADGPPGPGPAPRRRAFGLWGRPIPRKGLAARRARSLTLLLRPRPFLSGAFASVRPSRALCRDGSERPGGETEARGGEGAGSAGYWVRLGLLSELDPAAALWPSGETEARGHTGLGTRAAASAGPGRPKEEAGRGDGQGAGSPGVLVLPGMQGDLSSPCGFGGGLASTPPVPETWEANQGRPDCPPPLPDSHFLPAHARCLAHSRWPRNKCWLNE